jgi:hypothetical protein
LEVKHRLWIWKWWDTEWRALFFRWLKWIRSQKFLVKSRNQRQQFSPKVASGATDCSKLDAAKPWRSPNAAAVAPTEHDDATAKHEHANIIQWKWIWQQQWPNRL